MPPAARSSRYSGAGSRIRRPQPGNEAGCSHRRPEAVGDRLQQRIADPMAQRVIYDLEPIEVQVEQGKALILVVTIVPGGLQPDNALLDLFPEMAPVGKAGQSIFRSEPHNCFLGLVSARDVCKGAYKAAVRKCGAPHFEYRTVRTGTLIHPQPADRVALREILQCRYAFRQCNRRILAARFLEAYKIGEIWRGTQKVFR